ncbi:MAG: NAD(P)(+) transhydrogenase (Re/Si-specific) subunit beta [Gammaproteobacteria bacterium]|nr:NAD(P)(+) transhydrogenase (Re/Si-specific) subunit beta [Gammaproteobacteria bacterium]
MTLTTDTLALTYLVAAALFIFGLKGLTHPSSARSGNWYAIAGMVIAVVATLLNPEVKNYTWIVVGVLGGAIIGTTLALKIKMTAMPQLVALLHSFVGLCATLVAIGTYLTHARNGELSKVLMSEIFVGAFIGAITFTGSLMAFGKLQALLPSNPVVFRGQHLLNLAIALVMFGLGVDFVAHHHFVSLIALCLVAAVLGVTLILPIGGADMPVVISMLNSYSGWAAAATGFTLSNHLLIVTGALVGFSGAILSYIMSKAMNRSIISIVLGGFGGDTGGESVAASAAGKGVKTAAVEDAVFLMANASKVLVVPGYGMAVAQAQHALKEVMEILIEKGVEVKFAIHPVAGRMPGHMNVLLAEADVSYDHVFEMEEINPEFTTADVALVVGANDVTNPAAKTDKSSPIYGMPILEVARAKHILFVNRSMKPGYAGVDNLLFYQDNCSLVFGDAKEVCEKLAAELRSAA